MRVIPFLITSILFGMSMPLHAQYFQLDTDGTQHYFYDSLYNGLPDYSYAGYGYGEDTIPTPPVSLSLAPQSGDQTAMIQTLLDSLSTFAPDPNGLRGMLVLEAGTYEIQGTLSIHTSGVHLIGQQDSTGTPTTIFSATGDTPEQRNVIEIGSSPNEDWFDWIEGSTTAIIDPYLPLNTRFLTLSQIGNLTIGADILIVHPSTNAWLEQIEFGNTASDPSWNPREIDLIYKRTIKRIIGNQIELDVPIYDHFERPLSQAVLYQLNLEKEVREVALKHLSIEIASTDTLGLDHARTAIQIHGGSQIWIEGVDAYHFSYAAVETVVATNITVKNCGGFEPHSPITGGYRYNFVANRMSNQILFDQCIGSKGRHAYIVNGTSTSSGIVFKECTSTQDYNTNEGHRRWSHAILFDQLTCTNPLTTNLLGLHNRGSFGTGHGWASVHSTAWGVQLPAGNRIILQRPPKRQNYALYCDAVITNEHSFVHPLGHVAASNETIPFSLYQQQSLNRKNQTPIPNLPLLSSAIQTANEIELEWVNIDPEQAFTIQFSPTLGTPFVDLVTLTPSQLLGQNATTVHLPHTWNAFDATDLVPGYRRNASWYIKTKTIQQYDPQKRYFLSFEGANIQTEVWVNDQKAGSHLGGYVGFEIELTPYLQTGPNTIAVRVDNSISREVIPSQKADFFIFGGLVRDVHWVERPQVYLEQLAIHTPEVTQSIAQTDLMIKTSGNLRPGMSLSIELIDGDRVMHQSSSPLKDTQTTLNLPPLANPKLWHPDEPHLYSLQVKLKENGVLIDQTTERFGYRFYSFEPHGAFYLNGERLKLRGTHLHEEHAGYGMALPDSLHRKNIAQIKEMGANFIRLAHYPQDPSVYQACDELGLIVWDELPWCRGGLGNETWKTNTTRLLKAQIEQNYNHPSILFWSLGNEIYWLPDFEGGDDTNAINSFLTHLQKTAKDLDPHRYTAIRKYYEGSDIVDVFSPSIWSGWYAGAYVNYEQTLLENKKKYPQFLHMEYGGSSHVGRHRETPIAALSGLDEANWAEVVHQSQIVSIAKSGDWSESYMVDLFDWYLHISEESNWFAGNAQWAFKDFGTPLRPENSIPYINQKGLVDRAGKPKDAYYVFKSYWSTSPFVWIESPTWTHRFGNPGDTLQQCVYSNADQVELFLNGQSLGRKQRNPKQFPAQGLSWDIPLNDGVNQLKAVGYQEEAVIDQQEHEVIYGRADWGKPDHISLTATAQSPGRYLVTAMMCDADGKRIFDYEKRVYFDLSGAGDLLTDYGTPTRSQLIEFANGRAQIELQKEHLPVTVEARNQNFKGSYITIK